MQVNAAVDIVPDKAFFRPGDGDFSDHRGRRRAGQATITHLADTLAVLGGRARWVNDPELDPPPDAPRGYGITVRLLDGDRTLATASTAFDVLARWTQAPRTGF